MKPWKTDKTIHMKRQLTFFLLFSGWTSLLFSQQTLQEPLHMLRDGDAIVKQQVLYKDPGRSGENVLWDFSNLSSLNEEYKLTYRATGENLITGTEHNTMYYYSLSNDSLLLWGYENPTTLLRNHQPELLLKFPVNQGDRTESYYWGEGKYCDKLYFSAMGTVHSHADATGTLILPDKDTIRNAFRVRTVKWIAEEMCLLSEKYRRDTIQSISADSINYRLTNDSTLIGVETYRWYVRGYRYPVFETVQTVINRKDSIQNETFFNTAFFYPPQSHSYLEDDELNQVLLQNDPLGTGGSDPSRPDSPWHNLTYNVYPNPVQINLELEINLPIPAQTIRVQLTDRQGRILMEDDWGSNPAGILIKQIFMGQYIRGEYVLNIWFDETFMVSEKVMKR